VPSASHSRPSSVLDIVTNPPFPTENRIALARRSFCAALGAGLLTGCISAQSGSHGVRLASRPGKPSTIREPGLHSLALREQRDSLLYVPKSAASLERPAPLMVYLHGATGSEQQGIKKLSPFADDLGFLVLSPASQGGTWDAIQEVYGPDVSVIDQALARTFAGRLIDPRRIAISGFSDGASYALGLGLSNGDLFTSVLAFSPGFIPAGSRQTGKPRVFVSHGTSDTILPIESCSRRIVPELSQSGYQVTFREFDGPHTVPREITEEAMRWFLA
jgi:phospholipase/carboxylesterase